MVVPSTVQRFGALGMLAIVVAIGLIGLLVEGEDRRWGWLAILILLALFFVFVGVVVRKEWLGCLIDERNKVSLSRLQIAVWTLILLSGYFTAVLGRIADDEANPLAVSIPEQLWILVGISTTALVGTPLLRSAKVDEGLIEFRSMTEKAVWTDIFKGDEEKQKDTVDMAKVQMFFFTLILAFGYAVMLFNDFSGGKTLDGLAPFDEGMIALLGISHAGYLTSKAVPRGDPSKKKTVESTVQPAGATQQAKGETIT